MSLIRANEHVFIAGMTQSGKTFLTQNYLAHYTSTQKYILDTKGKFDFPQVGDNLEIVEHIADLPNTKSINVIYRPVWEELNEDYYNQFFEFCMKRRNCIIVIDEAMQVCPNPHRIPSWYKGALTRGMELQVGVWSLSQRPSTIPIVIISEATHIFVFKLNMLDDRKRIVKITGYSEFEEQAEKHHFWYFDVNKAQRPAYGTLKVKSLGTRS